MKKVTGPNNIYDSYEYDEYGREIAVTSYYIEEEKSFTTRKDYDENNRVVEITYPSGFAISYLYNNYGYLNEVKRKDNSNTIWKAGAMNEFGQWKDYTLGNNLLMSEFGYDANGMPETIKTKRISDNEIRQNLEYSFNPITGNLTNRKDHMHKLGENSFIEEFGYDNLNRLEWYKLNGGTQQYMVYDNNKTGVIQNKALVGEYLYEEKQPHAISTLNSIQSGVLPDAVYTYTSFNKVDTISEDGKSYSITYGPDYTRRKSICTINGSSKTTWYDGFYEMSEEGGISRQFHYISGGDGLAAIYVINNGQPGMYYLHKDYLGSYNVIIDDNGNEFAENSFDPWGRRRNTDDWSYDNVTVNSLFARGFTGHEHLDAFGLINMNGRVYDPVLGMFLSPDNYVQAPDFTQNFNRYSYCYNNPLSYVDPSGEIVWFVPVIVGAVIGGTTGGIIAHNNGQEWWKGVISGAIVGATLGYGISGAIGATGMTTVAANGATVATKSAGLVSTMLNSGSINIAMNAFSGGGWDGAWKAGLVGLATGGWNVTGGFGMVKGFGSSNTFAQLGGKLGYQMIGTAGVSIGNNWARGEDPLSKVTLGVGPVNLTLGKGQNLLQWQNNIGNIATNAFGLGNLAFGGKVEFDWKNLSLNYTGGIIDKFYDPRYWYSGFGAHSVIGNSALFANPTLYPHELHHLWQSRAFGDMFLLNYGLQGIGAMLMGGSFLKKYNYFEDQAYGSFWW